MSDPTGSTVSHDSWLRQTSGVNADGVPGGSGAARSSSGAAVDAAQRSVERRDAGGGDGAAEQAPDGVGHSRGQGDDAAVVRVDRLVDVAPAGRRRKSLAKRASSEATSGPTSGRP